MAIDPSKKLQDWAERQKAEAILLAQHWAGTLEGRAKSNAKWKDRTSNARNGLFGGVEVREQQNEIIIRLGHSVDYGVFLELGHDGRFAILKPTVNAAANEVAQSYRKLWT